MASSGCLRARSIVCFVQWRAGKSRSVLPLTLPKLMKSVQGPDFPTGGIICGRDGIKDAYQTGRGSLRIRAKAKVEQIKGNRQALVVTELPYQVNKANLIEVGVRYRF